jgi:ornithine cyclodeaminase/alanine dehydrogenase-like protein (mu-crystallin family)
MSESTLLINQEQIKSLLDMPTVLKIVERVYRSHGEGKGGDASQSDSRPWEHHTWPFTTPLLMRCPPISVTSISQVSNGRRFQDNYKIGLPSSQP